MVASVGPSYGLVYQLSSISQETAYRIRSLLPTEPEASTASLHVRLLCWPFLPEFLAKKAKKEISSMEIIYLVLMGQS